MRIFTVIATLLALILITTTYKSGIVGDALNIFDSSSESSESSKSQPKAEEPKTVKWVIRFDAE